jgi:hypothetical protein
LCAAEWKKWSARNGGFDNVLAVRGACTGAWRVSKDARVLIYQLVRSIKLKNRNEQRDTAEFRIHKKGKPGFWPGFFSRVDTDVKLSLTLSAAGKK